MVSKPQTLGKRYKLEERIASGGMGTVYIATDKRLHRRVAVKLLGSHLSHDETYIERFRREARAAAALSHTNIAAVYDYGEDDGEHFIVMELVAAHDLSKVLRNEGKFSPERAIAIASQLAEALGHAHAAGMIHRDVKPANILIGRNDHVKVTDFGIARTTGDVTLTATGSVLGSAHYISPEQASGLSLGPASDVYSAGIVLFEMLTGAVPFTGDSIVAVAMRHVNETVPPASSLAPEVSGEIDEVLSAATAHEPDRRYQDGSELAAALQGLRSTAPSAAVAAGAGAAGAGAAAGATAVLSGSKQPGFVPFEERWQPQKVGRIVVLGFLALVLVLFLLGAFRFVAGPPTSAPGPEATADATETTDTQEDTFIMPDYSGEKAERAAQELDDEGFEVQTASEPSEESEGTVVRSDPEAGSTLDPGQTVTLIVSSGDDDEDDDDDDDEDDDDDDGPGRGKGKDKKPKDRGDG